LLSGPVRIAFSFDSHALQSSNDLVLLSQACLRGLVSCVSGSQPTGRGFESRLEFFNFSFEANALLYKVKSFETCDDL
ncbi:MAG: hypothetical protein PV344_05850, partial [Anaplasma sp.]|nr:hypothetical protein [Anaplasma sp.]